MINAPTTAGWSPPSGCSDMVIVQTAQITVVCPLRDAERIKELVAEVAERLGTDYT